MYQLDILICPRCNKGNLESSDQSTLTCSACNEKYPIVNDIPVLLKDASARSQLEDVDYNQRHQVNEVSSDRTYKQWKRIFDKFGKNYGDLLEIGCGTGMLTYGLIKNNEFNSIHASDISLKFINMLQNRTNELNNSANYYTCDANYLPFKENSFDTVVGNSVLHHFLDYPQTLQQAYHILRKDGVAIFFEPIIQGKIHVTFILKLMLDIQRNFNLNIFDDNDIQFIEKAITHQVTIPNIKHDRERLANIEDKYIFDLTELESIANDIGYSNFYYSNATEGNLTTYKPYVIGTLSQFGIGKDKVDKFEYLFDAFSDTYGKILSDQLVSPMGYFVLQK
jgi:ubiquinone/menaquinone biosynthesis C-methylase UbiE